MLRRAASHLAPLCSKRWMLGEDACTQLINIQRAALHTTAVARQETPVPDQSQPSIEPVPKVAKILGFAGAIPFLALTPQVVHSIVLLPDAWVANAGLLQITYGVGIASFLGGIHWAMAMAEYGGPALSRVIANDRYLWSVSPCLLAWPAIVMPQGPAALVVASTLLGCYLVDRKWASMNALPRWYMSLRAPLTAAAVAGLGLTMVGSGSQEGSGK